MSKVESPEERAGLPQFTVWQRSIDLEHSILLLLAPGCWDYRHAPDLVGAGDLTRALCMLNKCFTNWATSPALLIVALTGSELTMYNKQALSFQGSFWSSLPSAGIICVCPTLALLPTFGAAWPSEQNHTPSSKAGMENKRIRMLRNLGEKGWSW